MDHPGDQWADTTAQLNLLSSAQVDQFLASLSTSGPCPDHSFELPRPWALKFPSGDVAIPDDLPEPSISDVETLYGNRLENKEPDVEPSQVRLPEKASTSFTLHQMSAQGEPSTSLLPLPPSLPTVTIHQPQPGSNSQPKVEQLEPVLGGEELGELIKYCEGYDDKCVELQAKAIAGTHFRGEERDRFIERTTTFYDAARLRNIREGFDAVHSALICSMILSADARFGPLTAQQHLARYHCSNSVCALLAVRIGVTTEAIEAIVLADGFQWATCPDPKLRQLYLKVADASARETALFYEQTMEELMQYCRVLVSTKTWLAPDIARAFPIPAPTETAVDAHARLGTLLHSTESREIQDIREGNPTMGGISYSELPCYMAYYESKDAAERGDKSRYRTRIFGHGLILQLVIKIFHIMSRRSPWGLSRYLKQKNTFIIKGKTGSFSSVTAVAASVVCIGMLDYKRFLHAVNLPENQHRPFPVIKMSEKAQLLRSGNLRVCRLMMEWLHTGGVSSQRDDGRLEFAKFNPALKRDGAFANGFCFSHGLAALLSSQGKTGDIVEDFASVPTPSSVARLPTPNTGWIGTRLAYFQGPKPIDEEGDRNADTPSFLAVHDKSVYGSVVKDSSRASITQRPLGRHTYDAVSAPAPTSRQPQHSRAITNAASQQHRIPLSDPRVLTLTQPSRPSQPSRLSQPSLALAGSKHPPSHPSQAQHPPMHVGPQRPTTHFGPQRTPMSGSFHPPLAQGSSQQPLNLSGSYSSFTQGGARPSFSPGVSHPGFVQGISKHSLAQSGSRSSSSHQPPVRGGSRHPFNQAGPQHRADDVPTWTTLSDSSEDGMGGEYQRPSRKRVRGDMGPPPVPPRTGH